MTNNVGLIVSVGDGIPRFTISNWARQLESVTWNIIFSVAVGCLPFVVMCIPTLWWFSIFTRSSSDKNLTRLSVLAQKSFRNPPKSRVQETYMLLQFYPLGNKCGKKENEEVLHVFEVCGCYPIRFFMFLRLLSIRFTRQKVCRIS